MKLNDIRKKFIKKTRWSCGKNAFYYHELEDLEDSKNRLIYKRQLWSFFRKEFKDLISETLIHIYCHIDSKAEIEPHEHRVAISVVDVIIKEFRERGIKIK